MAVGVPVNFDGTNDFLTRDAALTGSADGKIFLLSCWLRVLGGSGTARRIITFTTGASTSRLTINFNASDNIGMTGRDSAAALILDGSFTPPADTDWHHILISVDLGNASNRAIYVDGTLSSPTWSTYVDAIIDLVPTTTPNATIGSTPNGAALFVGDLAELFFDTPATWFDPSTGGNLAKFISGGAPVDLGADGSTPLGVQPLICLNAATTGAWATNVGSGGGFTENGALTDGGLALPSGVRKFILTRPA